ncbi:Tudor domain-containing protein 1 [Amphibalanus amphitrite]|uniref:Tudor domain-containing protein 1 n=1 Tax=Amphibalanus amphitrite TaxID=1232801 RepID=A0A6A4VDK6_AMPAM|nr:Tudor domain-containing protein 1 [Amphibalanus amphitrite]
MSPVLEAWADVSLGIGPYPPLERPFSAGERVEVFVACVLSPSRLYVQLSENTAEIEQMATDIEASTADCKVPCPDVAPEELCLAPFEGVYYRGLITAVDGQTVTVFFVDYGNTERVNVSELVECPMSLVDLPAQAIQCSMTGLVSADCGEQLAAKVDQMELTALVDRVLPGSLIVTLLSGSTNINLELGGDGQARSPEPAAKKAAAPTSAPAAAPAPAPVAPAPAQAATAQAAPAAEEVTETAAPFTRVTVSFAVTPHEFYVQDAADVPAAQLDELMAQLETEYSQLGPQDRAVKQVQTGDAPSIPQVQTADAPSIPQVQTGDLVAAPFADDGVFYRARLLTAEPGAADCQLHFIDYGNCQLTPRAQLKLLTPGLLAPAPLAQRCRLPERPATGQWTDEDTELFEQLAGTLEKALALRREAGAAEDVWTVRLLDGDTDVGRELVKAGRAVPPGQEPPAAVAEKVTTEAAPVQETAAQSRAQPAGPVGAARLKNGQLLEAAVVFAVSPTDFWVQLSADTATLDDLMARLEAAQLSSAAAPAAGQLLVARYAEDEALYRARVLTVSGDTATVLFVDYGNTESVSAAELWSCPPDLSGVPPLAVRCSLPLEPQPWSDAAVDKFSMLVGVGGAEERTLNMELVKAGDPALVNLFDGQQDVAFEMVGAGFGMVHVEERPVLVPAAQKAAEEPAPAPPAPVPAVPPAEAEKTDTEAESEPAAQADEATESQSAPVPTTPAGDQAVFVSHVNSPLEFYVQSADTGPLDELMERVAGEFPAAAPVSTAAPGLLAAAPYSEDGAPYRARVLAVEDGQARVLFVDYGNSESVDVTEVRQLGAELAALPPQARRCQLAVDACEEGATEKLRELTEAEEEPVTVSEVAAGAVSRVRLTLSAGDAAQLLVEAGLCRPREDTQLPAAPPPPAEPLRLLVSHVDSPACFFAQRLSDLAALDELADQLAELYDATESPPALAAPCRGDLCVARSAEEEGWHRARVEAVSPTGDVHVRLLDYGSVAAATEVRAAAPAVCRTPAMALRCRLPARPADGADWGQEATAALAELCDAAHYEFDARLVAEADGEPLVALLCLEGRSVTQTLQERGVAMVPESLAAESVQVKPTEGMTKEKKPVERETETKPSEEASEKEKPAEEASEKEKPVEEAHEEEKPTDKEGTDDKVAKELDSLSLTERHEEGETKGSTEPSSQEPTETEQAEQNADETKQGLDESKSHETGKSSEATDSSEETQRDMEEDKTDQKSEVTAGASEEKTADSDKEAVAEKPSSSDSAAPADAAETEESTSKVDEDTPGNGHVSPVNGDDVPEAAAQSVGQKASAVEEAPDAHEDAQAAA